MFLSDSWIGPEQLLGWQQALYRKKFNAGTYSYKLRYVAACKGNRISVDRMNWLADAIAIERLKGSYV